MVMMMIIIMISITRSLSCSFIDYCYYGRGALGGRGVGTQRGPEAPVCHVCVQVRDYIGKQTADR